MLQTLGKIDKVDPNILNYPGCIHFTHVHFADYLAEPLAVELQVVLLNAEGQRQVIITDQDIQHLLAGLALDAAEQFTFLAAQSQCKPISLDRPLALGTVDISKPWGKEVWYTGIEARGLSTVNQVPLPWLLAIFGPVLGYPLPPMLLKILAPLPDDNLGDLYFEMHEYKTEVYVVTDVDPVAWPDGIGKIRYGFNPTLRKKFDNDASFLQSYVEAVERYETTRKKIDLQLGHLAMQNRLSEPVSAADQKHLDTMLPDELRTLERQQRNAMYAYTRLVDLKIGDVVRVPPFLPHSLQHGVRVVEFQTPHYERFILSFGQKVLTQDTWDTQQVIDRVDVSEAEITPPDNIEQGIDLVADFDQFRVLRLQLNPGDSKYMQHNEYAICMGIQGQATLSDDHLKEEHVRHISEAIIPESAFLIPPDYKQHYKNDTNSAACILIALSKTAL